MQQSEIEIKKVIYQVLDSLSLQMNEQYSTFFRNEILKCDPAKITLEDFRLIKKLAGSSKSLASEEMIQFCWKLIRAGDQLSLEVTNQLVSLYTYIFKTSHAGSRLLQAIKDCLTNIQENVSAVTSIRIIDQLVQTCLNPEKKDPKIVEEATKFLAGEQGMMIKLVVQNLD